MTDQPKVKINMLTTAADNTISGVVDIDGQVSIIRNLPINKEVSTPSERKEMLITRAFIQQDKERPSNDD